MSYSAYYGLECQPFSNAPDPRFYFNSDQHSQALLRLIYAVDSNKGLAVLLGGIGTGKTTLARRMLDSLPEDKYQSSLLVVVHSGVTSQWIMTRIAQQLGVREPAEDRILLLKQLYERLLEIDQEGRKAVVLIDEAQMLRSQELMEEFRGLLNLEIPSKKLLNLIFFGMPDLDETLHLDEPLAQRVAIKFHLHSLTEKATQSYIRHRLSVAGADSDLFCEEAIAKVFHYAQGIPRLINTLCDNAMFEAYLRRTREIDEGIIDSVASDLGLTTRSTEAYQAEVAEEDLAAIDQMLDRLDTAEG